MGRKEVFFYELHKSQDHGGRIVSSGHFEWPRLVLFKEYMVILLFIHKSLIYSLYFYSCYFYIF